MGKSGISFETIQSQKCGAPRYKHILLAGEGKKRKCILEPCNLLRLFYHHLLKGRNTQKENQREFSQLTRADNSSNNCCGFPFTAMLNALSFNVPFPSCLCLCIKTSLHAKSFIHGCNTYSATYTTG